MTNYNLEAHMLLIKHYFLTDRRY